MHQSTKMQDNWCWRDRRYMWLLAELRGTFSTVHAIGLVFIATFLVEFRPHGTHNKSFSTVF